MDSILVYIHEALNKHFSQYNRPKNKKMMTKKTKKMKLQNFLKFSDERLSFPSLFYFLFIRMNLVDRRMILSNL